MLTIFLLVFPGWAIGMGYGAKSMMKTGEISLKGRIYSTPALRLGSSFSETIVSLVIGTENKAGEKGTSINVVNIKGRNYKGFPVLDHTPYQVAPGSQVAISDQISNKTGSLIGIDMAGKLWRFSLDNAGQASYGHADLGRGLLVSPPLVLPKGDNKETRVFMVSQDFTPHSPSRNAVHLVNIQGVPCPGFPQQLPAPPAQVPPIIIPSKNRVYVLLENGQVTGFNLNTGQLLKGFPTPELKNWPESPAKFIFHDAWNAIVLSTGTGSLILVTPDSGQCRTLDISEGLRLTGLASNGDQLFVMDEGGKVVLVMDPGYKIVDRIGTDLPDTVQNLFLTALVGKEKTLLISISLPQGDHQAKVAQVFRQHAALDDFEVIQSLADETARRDYKTSDPALMTVAQRNEYNFDITAMKYSWLQNKLGWETAEKLVDFPPVTRVQAIIYSSDNVEMVLDETVEDYTPTTDFGLSPVLFPAIEKASEGWVMALPFNYSRQTDDPKQRMRSLLRLYQLKM